MLREVRDGSETNPQAPISNEPRDPAEAAKRLAKLCRQLEDHIDEYEFEPDETGVSSELVQWFVAAVKKGGSLELALGLRRGKGRPKETGPGKHFEVASTAVLVLRADPRRS